MHTKCKYIASVGYLAYNYATKPQKIGLFCTRTEIHFIDGYFSHTLDLPFQADKIGIDGQVCSSR